MTSRKHSQRGFTLIELLVVIAIILAVAAMAFPNIMGAVDNVKLRSAASGVAGLMQQARQLAVKDNRYYTCRGTLVGNNWTAFIDARPYPPTRSDGSGNGTYDLPSGGQPGESMVQLPARVVFDNSGGNPAFDNAALVGPAFNPQPGDVMPSFNARGLPCVMVGSVCSNVVGGRPVAFRYFIRFDSSFGTKWGALTVTNAGRVKTWTWSGSSWN